jgi:hypothetical protein
MIALSTGSKALDKLLEGARSHVQTGCALRTLSRALPIRAVLSGPQLRLYPPRGCVSRGLLQVASRRAPSRSCLASSELARRKFATRCALPRSCR